VLEPAHPAGAQAGEHDARVPRLAQDVVEAVLAPDREQVAHRPAADVDDVLAEDERAQVIGLVLEAKERQVPGPAGAAPEGGATGGDLPYAAVRVCDGPSHRIWSATSETLLPTSSTQ
jgi:hypothetical protein